MQGVKGKILAIFLDKISFFQENDDVSHLKTQSVVFSKVNKEVEVSVIVSHFHENNELHCLRLGLSVPDESPLDPACSWNRGWHHAAFFLSKSRIMEKCMNQSRIT